MIPRPKLPFVRADESGDDASRFMSASLWAPRKAVEDALRDWLVQVDELLARRESEAADLRAKLRDKQWHVDEIAAHVNELIARRPSLADYGERTHRSSKRRGFHTPRQRSLGEYLCHAHDELAEVMRAFLQRGTETWQDGDKPEGMAAELADVILLCTEIAHVHGVDLDAALEKKAAYNDVRPANPHMKHDRQT